MNLNIGTMLDGKPFTLPADLGDKKIALLAQSKKGKTYGLGCLLEELAKAQRPFIATDPASNLWGLRVLQDGTPSGLKVVVIGGPHADIPFDKDAGARMAELLLSTPICAVIDLAYESAADVRKFMIAFAGRLMQSKPDIARVIVLEEAPELIPQNAFGIQAQICKTAVAKLAIVGGNFNYGVIPACQRPATLDKNVLSQCEGLIVMGITHKKDRDTVREWMEAKDIGEQAAAAFNELGSLKPGEAWYWNPGEDRFERFTFRRRETLHPREMQKLGLKASAVQLGDMQTFVEKAKRELTKLSVAVSPPPKNAKTREALGKMVEQLAKTPGRLPGEPVLAVDAVEKYRIEKAAMEGNYVNQISTLKADLQKERDLRKQAEQRLQIGRDYLKPQFDALKRIFEEIGEASPTAAAGCEISEAWTTWLEKAPSDNYRNVLKVLIKSGRLKKRQLATLSGVQFNGGTWSRVHAWLMKNSLVVSDGEEIEAVKL